MIFLDELNSWACLEERGRGGHAWGSDSLSATGSRLFLAGSLDFRDPSWCCRAPETTTMSSRTSELNKVISVQHVSKCNEKKMYEQMEEFTCSISLWWILEVHLPMVYLFYILFNFFPRFKIQYLKVGSGKVNQIALTLIPQMCLFVHV